MDLNWDKIFPDDAVLSSIDLKLGDALSESEKQLLLGYYSFSFAWGREAYRILKPGGYVLSFTSIKTQDILSLALRRAGLEKRDILLWSYLIGFPKGQDMARAFDEEAGVYEEREIIKANPNWRMSKKEGAAGFGRLLEDNVPRETGYKTKGKYYVTKPKTEDAQKWDGWHTNLRTAYEPIVMFMKPREGTFTDNLRVHEVGALNIDATRIPFDESEMKHPGKRRGGTGQSSPFPGDHDDAGEWTRGRHKKPKYYASDIGRYPTNIIRTTPFNDGYDPVFLIPKPTIKEKGDFNRHPSVKPLELCEHLVKLVAKKGQIILDPFCGSGTTCLAAFLHDMQWIGIDINKQYLEWATRRLKYARKFNKLTVLLE